MPVYTIDAANATARRAEDKAKVDKYIEEGPGFARVNQMMERELRRSAVEKSWSWGCCMALRAHGRVLRLLLPDVQPVNTGGATRVGLLNQSRSDAPRGVHRPQHKRETATRNCTVHLIGMHFLVVVSYDSHVCV